MREKGKEAKGVLALFYSGCNRQIHPLLTAVKDIFFRRMLMQLCLPNSGCEADFVMVFRVSVVDIPLSSLIDIPLLSLVDIPLSSLVDIPLSIFDRMRCLAKKSATQLRDALSGCGDKGSRTPDLLNAIQTL